jgi:hypothetical protein
MNEMIVFFYIECTKIRIIFTDQPDFLKFPFQ